MPYARSRWACAHQPVRDARMLPYARSRWACAHQPVRDVQTLPDASAWRGENGEGGTHSPGARRGENGEGGTHSPGAECPVFTRRRQAAGST